MHPNGMLSVCTGIYYPNVFSSKYLETLLALKENKFKSLKLSR